MGIEGRGLFALAVTCGLAVGCGDGSGADAGADAGAIACSVPDGSVDGGSPCGSGMVCVSGFCAVSECGDGVVDPQAGEECDDANAVAFDGCDPGCTFSCDEDSQCDDGLECNGMETCSAHACMSSVRPANGTECMLGDESGVCRDGACVVGGCGDGMVAGDEHCDDGNTTALDGCELDCRFSCEVDPSVTNTWYADCDGDGYASLGAPTSSECLEPAPSTCGGGWTLEIPVAGSSDCDDTNPGASPGGAEACDGVDNDCDGTIDDGVLGTFFRDADGDTFGNAASSMTGCAAPSGYVEDNTDCNDACTACYPGATEVCDAADNDCDGSIDDGVLGTFFLDTDGDGHGNAASSMMACTAPAGYVSTSDDCNDACTSCYPGASELCDGLDNNCNSTIDEGVGTTFYRDNDGDGYGNPAMTVVACSAPAGYVANNTDCNDGAGAVHPGATELCGNAVDDNCSGSVDELPECHITCSWSGARWLSHGWDGGAHTGTGAWFSCSGGQLSYVQWVAGSGTGVSPTPAGTSDVLVGCNWSGVRWGSQGFDGGTAFTHGATVRCAGSRVTEMTWEMNSVSSMPAMPGDLGCNWTGAIFISHGIDGLCAFSTGFNITCNAGRITHFEWVEGCTRAR